MTAGIDRRRIAAAVREILCAIGEDPDRAELRETPERVAEAYAEMHAGTGVDPLSLLGDTTPVAVETGELVLVRDIAFRSICEHHLLPFRGRAHVAYRPTESVTGFGTVARLVDALASRLQLQERLGEQIAEALQEALAPEGVLVVLEASHGCVTDRGSRQGDALAVTIASRGVLTQAAERAEILTLIARGAWEEAPAPSSTIAPAPRSRDRRPE